MNSKPKTSPEKRARFSNDEKRALIFALGVGVVLGVAVEMLDAALPGEHKMSAVVERLMQKRVTRKPPQKSSYDMQRPEFGFSVTE
jgi:hypothetical protein